VTPGGLAPLFGWKVRGSVIFSDRDSGLFDLGVERSLGGSPGAGERCSLRDSGWELGVEFREGWVDDPRVGLGEEDGQSASFARQLVSLDAGDPLDEPFAPWVVGLLRAV
jgi:hypothetical protein